jgi:hypothetical protein
MRVATPALSIFAFGFAQAADLDPACMFGTWITDEDSLGGMITKEGRIFPGRVSGPIVISRTDISWNSVNQLRCTASYTIASVWEGAMFPGGPMENNKPIDAYTTVTLKLNPQDCDLNIVTFTFSPPSEQTGFAHFAAFDGEGGAHGNGPATRVSLKDILE